MRTFYEIKELLKLKMGIPTDKYLAEDIGIDFNNLRNRIYRNSIPFKEVLDFCKDKGLNPIEIIYAEAQNGKERN